MCFSYHFIKLHLSLSRGQPPPSNSLLIPLIFYQREKVNVQFSFVVNHPPKSVWTFPLWFIAFFSDDSVDSNSSSTTLIDAFSQ